MTDFPPPHPLTRLSDRDRRLLGLPKDPTDTAGLRRATFKAKKTKLVWRKDRIAILLVTTVITVSMTAWFWTLLLEKWGV